MSPKGVPTFVVIIVNLLGILQQIVRKFPSVLLEMKVIQLNIRSLNTSINLLELLIQRRNPDIILLQEVWQPKKQATVKGYQAPIMKLRQGSRGGGVAIYTKTESKQIALPKYEVDGLEAVWAEVMIGSKKTVVGSVYIPPGKIEEMKTFRRILSKVCNENNNVLVAMDANGRNQLWDDSMTKSKGDSKKLGDELMEAILENDLETLNNGQPTYQSESYTSAIDVTISKGCSSSCSISWEVLKDPIKSDHFPILVEVGISIEEQTRIAKDWKKMDWEEYSNRTKPLLKQLSDRWRCSEVDPDVMNSQLVDTLSKVVEEMVPTKRICRYSRPWRSERLTEQLKTQRRARNIWKRRRTPKNHMAYIAETQATETLIQNLRKEWWEEEIEQMEKAKPGNKWKIFERITNPRSKMAIQSIKQADGHHAFEDKDILALMENYFIDKSDMGSIDQEMENELTKWLSEAKQNTEGSSLHVADITMQEVQSTFGQCSNSPGPDGVNGAMIDYADRKEMAECLCMLWNAVWRTSKLPHNWKREHRVLLEKPGKDNYNQCNSYRTISLTDLVGKRMEKAVAERTVTILKSKNFDPWQFAYMEKRSASQALLLFCEAVSRSLERKELVGALFFDFSDAFGTVDRDKLLHKLMNKFSFSGKLIGYLKSFLEDREARIQVNGTKGEWKQSLYGTSAGTVLGAILFIIYLIDVPESIKPKFADDLVGMATGKSVEEVQTKLQKSMDELDRWSRKWSMTLNVDKTRVMIFGKPGAEVSILSEGIKVKQINDMKYLGVVLDERLDFNAQAEHAAAKARLAFSRPVG